MPVNQWTDKQNDTDLTMEYCWNMKKNENPVYVTTSLYRQKVGHRLPRAEKSGGEDMFNGYSVFAWNDEKILEIKSGNGCTALYVILWNVCL